jgi:serine/threonine protein phosphatase 1
VKHYVMTDIHGNFELFDKAMDWIEADSGDDYLLYFLGDAIDRGNDGYRIMISLLENSKVIYLKGNHEDMFVHAAIEYSELAMQFDCTRSELITRFDEDVEAIMNYGIDMSLYYQNGGKSTFQDWIHAGAKMNIVYKVRSLPLKAIWGNCDMCHAGCQTADWDNESALLWDRSHFTSAWFSERILIHGHTPLGEDCAKIAHYQEQKYDLDCGSWYTGILKIMRLEDKEIKTIVNGAG